MEKDYQHFDPPFLLSSDNVLRKIRNLTVPHLPSGTLFPQEVTQYDPWVIRETLHNCIAHQDYWMGGRINVVESPDTLVFTNLGSFIPGSVEEMIRSDAPPEVYRNRAEFSDADYELDDPKRVVVRLTGQVLDENQTRLLLENVDIDLSDVIALDQVQKRHPIDDETFRRLKSRKLIEGRRPNVFISATIAATTGEKAAYIKNRAFDKLHYRALVVAYLNEFGEAATADMEDLLLSKLSDALNEKQQKEFVKNHLQEMKRDGVIKPAGGRRWQSGALSSLAYIISEKHNQSKQVPTRRNWTSGEPPARR